MAPTISNQNTRTTSSSSIQHRSRGARPFLFEDKLYKPELFSNVIIAERRLRECLQRRETLSAEYAVQIKPPESVTIDSGSEFSDIGKADELSKQLADANNELYVRNHELFMMECQLPIKLGNQHINEMYHLYQKPGWYMDEVLVSNCVTLGGCCSRDCGCCATRVPDLNAEDAKAVRGAGHCTVECSCCSKALGLNLTVAQKDQLREDFENSLNGRGISLATEIFGPYFQLEMQDPAPERKEIEKEGEKSQRSTKQMDTHKWMYGRVALSVYFLALHIVLVIFYFR